MASPSDNARCIERLANFRLFLSDSERSSIFLAKSDLSRNRMMFALPRSGSSVFEASERDIKHIPGISRAIEAVFFNPQTKDIRKRTKRRSRKGCKRKLKAVDDADFELKHIVGAEIDGRPTGACVGKGKFHGTIVHRQVDEMLKRYMSGARNADGERFYYTDLELEHHHWDPCAIKFCNYMQSADLLPLATECVVYCSRLNLATAVDVVALHQKTGNIIFIEIKTSTGSSKTFLGETMHRGKQLTLLGEQLSDVPDTKYTRACVQLICTMLLAKTGRTPFAPDSGTIVYLSSHKSTASAFTLPLWYCDNSENMERWLFDQLQKHEVSPADARDGPMSIADTESLPKVSTKLLTRGTTKSRKRHCARGAVVDPDPMMLEGQQ